MRNPMKLLPFSLALLLAPTLASAEDLLQVFEQARQNDPTLAIAKDSNLSVGQNVDIATAALLPQIAATGTFTDSHGSSSNVQPVSNDNGGFDLVQYQSSDSTRRFNWGGRLDQSIIDFSRWTARKAAQEQARRGDAQYVQAEQDLTIRVSTAYFNVLTAEDSLTFSQAEEKALERQLDQAQQRFEVGLSAITDVNEAKAQYDTARAATISAQNALDDSREGLREITGKEPGTLLRLREKLPLVEPTPNDMQAWVDKAITENPGLKAQELALASANTNIKTQRAGHLPTLGGYVSYSNSPSWGESSSRAGSVDTHTTGFTSTIGLQLSVPIFSGGATQARVRQAVYDRDTAQDTFEQQKRALVRATRLNFRAVVAGISEVEARKQAVVSANSALEATQAGFEVGTRTIVDVLLSQRQLFQAQRDHSQARHNFVVNQLKLRQSAGSVEQKDLAEVNALLE